MVFCLAPSLVEGCSRELEGGTRSFRGCDIFRQLMLDGCIYLTGRVLSNSEIFVYDSQYDVLSRCLNAEVSQDKCREG